MGSTFLCRNEAERGRLLDMRTRLNAVEPIAAALLAVCAIAGVGTFGPGPIVAAVLALAALMVLRAPLDRLQRPELLLAGSFVFTQAMLTSAAVSAWNGVEYILPLFALPVALIAAEFPRRVVVVAWSIACCLVLAIGFGVASAEVAATPPILILPIVSSAILGVATSVVRELDAESRSTVLMDRLTGVLNRAALAPRVAELAHQSEVSGAPVALIIGDVDHFKLINDRFGHATGDRVLQEVASRLRRCVGSFEPIYRFGGEEFMIMLAGGDLDAGRALAEDLREAVGGEPVLSLPVTMSFGVGVSQPGEQFDFEDVFGAADAALYQAKRAGRDRVCGARLSGSPVRRGESERAEAGRRGETPPSPAIEGPAVGSWRHRLEEERSETGSLLVHDELEREHLLELQRRLRRVFLGCALVAGAAVAASAPWFGWKVLIPPVIGALIYNVTEYNIERFRRPEYALALSWLLLQASFAAGFALAESPALFALILFSNMMVGTSAVYPTRAVIPGLALTLLIVTGAALANAPDVVVANPATLLLPLSAVTTVALIGWAIGQSAIDHRSASVVDPLTGLLNRTALESRAAELDIQAATSGDPVGVIVCDLDHFKDVNDTHGHAAGDIVLREAAYRIRQCLRAFESAYRFGGEEFVVLLAGLDLEETERVAERVWQAIRGAPLDGVTLTMSVGAAASAPGERFDYSRVFAAADAALLEAKRSGRDRVQVARDEEPAVAV